MQYTPTPTVRAVNFILCLKGLIAVKKLNIALDNCRSLTFLSLKQPPQWKHWWRPLGAAIKCLVAGRLSMAFLVCGPHSTSLGGGVNFDKTQALVVFCLLIRSHACITNHESAIFSVYDVGLMQKFKSSFRTIRTI